MRRLTFLFLLIPFVSSGWSKDSLNHVDAKGKKDGYWKVFLDSLLYTTDSSASYFYAYNLYDHGAVVFDYGRREQHWKKDSTVYEGTFPVKGLPALLSRTFFWYDDSLLVNTEVYANGSPVYWEALSYSKHSDSLEPAFYEIFYFTKLYENTEGSFLWVNQFAGVPPTYYWFRKTKKGWGSEKIKEPFDPDAVK